MSDQNDKQDPNLQTNEIGIEDDGMDITLEQMSEAMRSHLVLKKALENNLEEEFLLKLDEYHRDRLKEMSAESLPLFMSNPSLLSSYSGMIIETYPELSAHVNQEIERVSGRMLLESSGYTDKEINEVEKTSPEFMDSLAVTHLHEETFGFKGKSLKDRLVSTKDSVLQSLGEPGAQRTLQAAGIAIGCATGGIVVSIGMKASGMLARKLAKTSGFQALMAGMTNSAEKVAAKVTGKSVEEVRAVVANRKKSLADLFKKPWVAIPSALAVGAMAFIAVGSTELGQQAIESVADMTGSALSGVSSGFSAVTESAISDAVANAEAESPGWSDRYKDGLPSNWEASIADAGAGALSAEAIISRARDSVLDIAGVAAEGIEIEAEPVAYTISGGDNLWNIAKAHLEVSGLDMSNRSIYEATQAIYEANAALIGDDPDLIMPGVEINIPDLGPKLETPDLACLAPGEKAIDSVAPVLPWGALDIEDLVYTMGTPDVALSEPEVKAPGSGVPLSRLGSIDFETLVYTIETPDVALSEPEVKAPGSGVPLSQWGSIDFETLVYTMESPGLNDNNGVINLDKEEESVIKRDRGGPDPSDF